MKIIIVGSLKNWGLAMIFKRAFCNFGHKVEIFDSWDIYRKNPFVNNAVGHRLLWRFSTGSIQRELIHRIKDNPPELILVFKGWLIKPSILRKIRSRLPDIKIFSLNPDNPFNTWHHGNTNNWIRKSIPIFDCYFIWGNFLVDKLSEKGAKRVEYLPFGYDKSLHYPVDVNDEDKGKYGSDISFIGNWDEEREKWLSGLLDYNLKIWGDNWEASSKKLREKWKKSAVMGQDFSKVCNASKINLNFIRRQNGSAHNMRTFEIPACGGFMLSTRTPEQESFFKEGKEADYFSSPEEMKEKIDYYLDKPQKRKKITERGYKKATSYKYSYKARAKKVLGVYNSIK